MAGNRSGEKQRPSLIELQYTPVPIHTAAPMASCKGKLSHRAFTGVQRRQPLRPTTPSAAVQRWGRQSCCTCKAAGAQLQRWLAGRNIRRSNCVLTQHPTVQGQGATALAAVAPALTAETAAPLPQPAAWCGTQIGCLSANSSPLHSSVSHTASRVPQHTVVLGADGAPAVCFYSNCKPACL